MLFPWGHRAVLVDLTRRHLTLDTGPATAGLLQRRLLIVPDPVRGRADDGALALALPFDEIEVLQPTIELGADEVIEQTRRSPKRLAELDQELIDRRNALVAQEQVVADLFVQCRVGIDDNAAFLSGSANESAGRHRADHLRTGGDRPSVPGVGGDATAGSATPAARVHPCRRHRRRRARQWDRVRAGERSGSADADAGPGGAAHCAHERGGRSRRPADAESRRHLGCRPGPARRRGVVARGSEASSPRVSTSCVGYAPSCRRSSSSSPRCTPRPIRSSMSRCGRTRRPESACACPCAVTV